MVVCTCAPVTLVNAGAASGLVQAGTLSLPPAVKETRSACLCSPTWWGTLPAGPKNPKFASVHSSKPPRLAFFAWCLPIAVLRLQRRLERAASSPARNTDLCNDGTLFRKCRRRPSMNVRGTTWVGMDVFVKVPKPSANEPRFLITIPNGNRACLADGCRAMAPPALQLDTSRFIAMQCRRTFYLSRSNITKNAARGSKIFDLQGPSSRPRMSPPATRFKHAKAAQARQFRGSTMVEKPPWWRASSAHCGRARGEMSAAIVCAAKNCHPFPHTRLPALLARPCRLCLAVSPTACHVFPDTALRPNPRRDTRIAFLYNTVVFRRGCRTRGRGFHRRVKISIDIFEAVSGRLRDGALACRAPRPGAVPGLIPRR